MIPKELLRPWPRNKRIQLALIALPLALVVGCSAHDASRSRSKSEIIIDQSLSKETIAPWLAYAGSRSLWIDKKFFQLNPGATSYQYTLAEEVEARQTCAAVWRHLRGKDGLSDRYLDELVAVMNAGFIREYTWAFFRVAGWSLPEGIKIKEFDNSRQQHLKNHKPETRATVRFIEK